MNVSEHSKDVFSKNMRELLKEIQTDFNEGNISQKEVRILMAGYDCENIVRNVGLKALRVFDMDVPANIGMDIMATFEKVRRAIMDYRTEKIDASSLRSIYDECKAKAAEIRNALNTGP